MDLAASVGCCVLAVCAGLRPRPYRWHRRPRAPGAKEGRRSGLSPPAKAPEATSARARTGCLPRPPTEPEQGDVPLMPDFQPLFGAVGLWCRPLALFLKNGAPWYAPPRKLVR